MASNLPILRTGPLRGLSVLGQLGPSRCKSDLRHDVNRTITFQTLGGYALMNQNTTIEATETKIDHVSVISIQKGSI